MRELTLARWPWLIVGVIVGVFGSYVSAAIWMYRAYCGRQW